MIKSGHNLDLISTDGVEQCFLSEDLKPYLRDKPSGVYDCQISYTAPLNYPNYLSSGTKNRFGIWCYEFAPNIPTNFVKYCSGDQYVDLILPPSLFAKDIFISSGVPESKLKVIPHGVDLAEIASAEPYPLKTKKEVKFLMVIGQPHTRKRIRDAIEAFYKAFTSNDNVCLVARLSSSKKITQAFEVDVHKIIKDLNSLYPNRPEIELIDSFVPSIYSLHKSCQVIYTLTYAEAFYIPALDGLYCNNVVIAPRYGGHLDFCNDNNSLLIDGKLVKAPLNMQYYQGSPQNAIFSANIDLAVDTLRYCYNNIEFLLSKFKPFFNPPGYSWDDVTFKIMELCDAA